MKKPKLANDLPAPEEVTPEQLREAREWARQVLDPYVPVTIIAAMDDEYGIGKDGRIPWNIPREMGHFRKTTMGSTVIMGRKTFESLMKPLEGRINIVLTSDRDYVVPGVWTANSVSEALVKAKRTHRKVFVIGGSEVYRQFMSICKEFILSRIPGNYECDSIFPMEYLHKSHYGEIVGISHNGFRVEHWTRKSSSEIYTQTEEEM
jgi:dihydrofolate reductase